MITQSCPLVGMGAKMTRNSFCSTCLARQAKAYRLDFCPACKKGEAVKDGRWLGPPAGIQIFMPTDWEPGPIIYPKEQFYTTCWSHGRKAKYPFVTMEIGEVYEGERENRIKIRSAAGNIGRKHNKKFETREEGNKIFVKRVK